MDIFEQTISRTSHHNATVTSPDDDDQVRIDVIVDLFSQRLQLYSRKAHTSAASDKICIHITFHDEYTIKL